jgi:hypothetical protein
MNGSPEKLGCASSRYGRAESLGVRPRRRLVAASTATTTTTAAVHHGLQAQLIAIKSGKSRAGLRVEDVKVQGGEPLTATLGLTRNGKRLAHDSIPGLATGDRVLTLPIPRAVKKGEATLTVTLSDSAGNHHTWTRTIPIPH